MDKLKITEVGFYPAMIKCGSDADGFIVEYDSIRGGLYWGDALVKESEFYWIGEKLKINWPGMVVGKNRDKHLFPNHAEYCACIICRQREK